MGEDVNFRRSGSFSTLSFEAQHPGMSPSPRKQTQDHALAICRSGLLPDIPTDLKSEELLDLFGCTSCSCRFRDGAGQGLGSGREGMLLDDLIDCLANLE